jgi:ABC-type iron transport system FetAB ATPase subunit
MTSGLQNVGLTLGDTAVLDDISMHVAEGRVSILGPSGCREILDISVAHRGAAQSGSITARGAFGGPQEQLAFMLTTH